MSLRSGFFTVIAVACALSWGTGAAAAGFKSVSDGKKDATAIIQKALDDCRDKGGGQVVIPAGDYLCGPIFLRSGVDIYLSRGARIMGKTDYRNDYDLENLAGEHNDASTVFSVHNERALIVGKGINDVCISGEGTIDGRSNLVDFNACGFKDNDGRPYAVLFRDCRNVSVRGISIVNSAFWTLRFWCCEKVIVDGVRINSMHFRNNDGIDIEARDAVITNCIIDAEDDGICLKSDNPGFKSGNIVISNCIVSSNCNPIKFGTSSYGGWENVTISNCVIRPTTETHFRHFDGWYKNVAEGYLGGMSGVAIECADGGVVRNINVSNITMSGVLTPVMIVLNRRHGLGTISDVSVTNITAYAEGVIPCFIAGLPEKKVCNVRLANINVIQRGGMKAMENPVPENPSCYPENRMFGHILPACGLWARHVDGLSVSDMRVRLLEPDARPCVVLDDVSGEVITNLTSIGTDGQLIRKHE